jgi:diguanylate cyclase (GGDEF)-like protein
MNDELLAKILDCPRLPSLPAIALEVIELCRQQDTKIHQIAATISNDPALSTKVLRTVNSSYYGLRQPVSTISHALVILGLNSVKTLALGFSLISDLRKATGSNSQVFRYWQECIYAAVGSRAVARQAGLIEHEEAFLGGLLQNLGVLALSQALGDDYFPLLQEAEKGEKRLWQLEREQFDLDHMQVGAALGEAWKLPPVLVAPIRHHEMPEQAPENMRPLINAVAVGARAADVFLGRPDAADAYFRSVQKAFNIDRQSGEFLLSTIGYTTSEVAGLFEIELPSTEDVQQILADANEALSELTLQSQINASVLHEQNQELQAQVGRDPLTGVANRGRFNESIDEEFRRARAVLQPVSLLFVDADQFKAVNDEHGHVAGDRVLVYLAETLRGQAPASATVTRYGGEEFAIVLPHTSRTDATTIAEKLRKSIESHTVDGGDGTQIEITVSIGVATFDGLRFFRAPEQLISAADKALYAAKSAGRNCVRVFAPRNSVPSAPVVAAE